MIVWAANFQILSHLPNRELLNTSSKHEQLLKVPFFPHSYTGIQSVTRHSAKVPPQNCGVSGRLSDGRPRPQADRSPDDRQQHRHCVSRSRNGALRRKTQISHRHQCARHQGRARTCQTNDQIEGRLTIAIATQFHTSSSSFCFAFVSISPRFFGFVCRAEEETSKRERRRRRKKES